MKSLKRRYKVGWSCNKAPERKEEKKFFFDHRDGEKLCRVEAQERWGLKKIPKGPAPKAAERVAKP
jgi:hypothetical protein